MCALHAAAAASALVPTTVDTVESVPTTVGTVESVPTTVGTVDPVTTVAGAVALGIAVLLSPIVTTLV